MTGLAWRHVPKTSLHSRRTKVDWSVGVCAIIAQLDQPLVSGQANLLLSSNSWVVDARPISNACGTTLCRECLVNGFVFCPCGWDNCMSLTDGQTWERHIVHSAEMVSLPLSLFPSSVHVHPRAVCRHTDGKFCIRRHLLWHRENSRWYSSLRVNCAPFL